MRALWDHLAGATITYTSLVILVFFDVVYSQCPSDVLKQMQLCTGKLRNTAAIATDLQRIEVVCKNLMDVCDCLESILNKCQENFESDIVVSLERATYMYKDRLHKICNSISDTGSNEIQVNVAVMMTALFTVMLIG